MVFLLHAGVFKTTVKFFQQKVYSPRIMLQVFYSLPVLLTLTNEALARDTSFFHIEKLSSNVYVFIPPRPMADVVHGNCTVIIGNDGLLVVDTFGDHIIAVSAISEIKKITPLPVKYILTTHWHYDHLGGNAIFKMNWPGAVLICHKDAMPDLQKRVIPNFQAEPQASLDIIADYTKAIETGKKDDSTYLSEYERNMRYPETIKDLQYFVDHFSAEKFRYASPGITFGDSLMIDLGSDTIKIFHPGWGHSPDDAMVFIPKQKILITGDIVIGPVPYAFNTIQNDWIKILHNIAAMPDADIIIPGHGEVMRDKKYITEMADLLENVTKKIKDCFDKGLTQQQTFENMNVETYRKKFAGDDPVKNWAFENYFLKPRIRNYYRQFKK